MSSDTPQHIYDEQMRIVLSKTESERIEMGFEMCAEVYNVVKNSIVSQSPNIGKADLAVAIFRRYYQNDFTEFELKEICESIRDYHLERKA